MKRTLLEHFEHWDHSQFPAHEQDHWFFCLCLKGAEDPALVISARPLSVRTECGVVDHYWVDASNTWTLDASHREVKPSDVRVVCWLRQDDPMLTASELVVDLEKARNDIRYWQSRYTALLAEVNADNS